MSTVRYTPHQQKVITHTGRHAVVSAVAGSGKTQTLVARLNYLTRSVSLDRLAVVMFNREAAASFRRRYQAAAQGSIPEIRTFNSMGHKITNRLVQLGHLPAATISDKDFQRTKLAKQALFSAFQSQFGGDSEPDRELIDDFVAFIAHVKADTLGSEETFRRGRYQAAAIVFPEAFERYEAMRRDHKLRFFEDQLYDPVQCFLRHPETKQLVTNRIDHLIVDEAQDMNGIQIELMKVLAGTRAAVMIVGDEDQAIYEWRGAKPDYITHGFEQDFPGATRYTLPHTFRFGHCLSLAASQLVSHNQNRVPKVSLSAPGTPRTIIRTIALPPKSPLFGTHIRALIDEGLSPAAIAVLVRTYSIAFSLELELHQLGIPYFVYGRPPLLKIPEVTALVAVLQLSVGSWRRLPEADSLFMFQSLLLVPSLYLTKDKIERVSSQAIRNPNEISSILRALIVPGMPQRTADQIADRADLLEIIATTIEPDEAPVKVIDLYLSGTKFEESLRSQASTPEQAEERLQNVQAVRQAAANFAGNVSEFLEMLDPLFDSRAAKPPDEDHVWIGSIHRSKGEQWPVVFVPGLVDGYFPRSSMMREDIEAERRLCYVAITRAVEQLYLVHPNDPTFRESVRTIDPAIEQSGPVSPFLWEMQLAISQHTATALETGRFTSYALVDPTIPNAYLRVFAPSQAWAYTQYEQSTERANSSRVPSKRDSAFSVGSRVMHSKFGPGRIVEMFGDDVAKIAFDIGPSRTISLKLGLVTPLK